MENLIECLLKFDLEGMRDTVQELIREGVAPTEVVNILTEGMNVVGQKYDQHEFFVSDLIMAGETMKAAMEVIEPSLKAVHVKAKGVVVIGTVEGDLHNIGKDIVIAFLRTAGFEVHDLGVNVSADKFVEAVRELKADIVGMSALLSFTMSYMKIVIDELEKAGLRGKVKVIVGGAPLDEGFAKRFGADAYAKDVSQGVDICKKWMEAV